MIIIIPLGGLGTRYEKNGYFKPKPLVQILGKTIIEYLIDNLNLDLNLKKINKIYIPYHYNLENFRFEDFIKNKYPNLPIEFFKLNFNTDGALHTLYLTLSTFNNIIDQPIISIDSDNFYLDDIITKWNGENKIFCFKDESESNCYSYVKNIDNKIIDIKEKEKISNNACCGAYGFSSWKDLLENSKIILDKEIKQKNEYYISNVIKLMIEKDKFFKMEIIDNNKYICLGTPLHLRIFYNNYPKINSITNKDIMIKKRFCFDLDNTLVSFPQIKDDYNSVKPIEKNINLLKYLKKLGHTIIIYTARRMKTHQGNTGKLMKDIGKITFDTLEKFEIPYDEIYFGKPQADFYIDDLALNAFCDLEKELGFYFNNIEPRSFHQIQNDTIDLLTKKGEDLSGEIYYYNNIPNEIKDIFPIMINYDINNKWFQMEKLFGLNCSHLYVNELLTKDHLGHIIGTLNRIHKIKIKSNISINYIEKINERIKLMDYNIFKDWRKILEKLIKYFENYDGKIGLIHGDPVLTNIMINQFGKIKMFDMRGKYNNKLTNQGDIFYDYAKLYQSLIGYDEILNEKKINENYKKDLINYFENKFLENYNKEDLEKVKMITNSLIFTLLPLHSKDKALKFYYLININEN